VNALPIYEMGPGHSQEELVINLVLYGMVLALLVTVLWVLWPFGQHLRNRGESSDSPSQGGGDAAPPRSDAQEPRATL
jgi:hypothetical protein